MSTLDVVKKPFTLDILKPAILSIISNSSPEEVLEFYSLNKLILCSVNMFFTNNEIEEIKKIYLSFTEQQDKTHELEFRVYPYIKGGKKESIQKFNYYYLLDYLKKSGLSHQYNFTIDIILNNTKKKDGVYRSTYKDFSLKHPVNQIKRRISDFKAVPTGTVFPLTFKLSLSSETDSSIQVKLKNQLNDSVVYNTIRIKYRDSFIFEFWRIDITKIITTFNISSPGIETYEIECEFIENKNIPFNTFLETMNRAYKLILQHTNYC